MNIFGKRLVLSLMILFCLLSCQKKAERKAAVYAVKNHIKAWNFYRQHQPDSAYVYYTKAAAETKDRSVLAQIYAAMAIIQSDQGDYYGSDETAVRSLRYFRENDPYLPSVYNVIAINKYKQRDYEGAAAWYQRAIATDTGRMGKLIYRNNLGVAYTELKRYDAAIRLFGSLLSDPLIKADTGKFAQALDNYHWAKWKHFPIYDADPGYRAALKLRVNIHDLWGQNASYAHLADYYFKVQPDSALKYATLMYRTAHILESPDDRLEALQKLVRLGEGRAAKVYFDRYVNLQDSISSARGASRSQFALVRYESEKAKAENLKLQKDITDQRYGLLRQRILLLSLLILIAVASVLVIGFIRRRQSGMRREAAERLRAQQQKTSKRVHDVLANDLYRIMSDLDNGTGGTAAELADRLEVLYERARDLSYEDEPVPLDHFEVHLAAMLGSFATERTKVLPDNCTAAFWQGTEDRVKQEVSLVLQELMVNVRKHSRASL
ncbi:MAG: tetratricopeptide repeat protein, partial [Mucilaginibacter sp.]|nr:tetratricopeptide repeat protein [Mucilaginibacter sp.]